ncbi:hypothetical protein EVAR_58744_1 [Eumeta japonica]|uniref:Uncharacterized protein n=1 Tax=Eumeta variegata TaxID=151549 RepID=A0A4C1YXK6_EUMVA|nr:hypothetical protein EVAR_58744_1 [Eumeta japonica]
MLQFFQAERIPFTAEFLPLGAVLAFQRIQIRDTALGKYRDGVSSRRVARRRWPQPVYVEIREKSARERTERRPEVKDEKKCVSISLRCELKATFTHLFDG